MQGIEKFPAECVILPHNTEVSHGGATSDRTLSESPGATAPIANRAVPDVGSRRRMVFLAIQRPIPRFWEPVGAQGVSMLGPLVTRDRRADPGD